MAGDVGAGRDEWWMVVWCLGDGWTDDDVLDCTSLNYRGAMSDSQKRKGKGGPASSLALSLSLHIYIYVYLCYTYMCFRHERNSSRVCAVLGVASRHNKPLGTVKNIEASNCSEDSPSEVSFRIEFSIFVFPREVQSSCAASNGECTALRERLIRLAGFPSLCCFQEKARKQERNPPLFPPLAE